MPKPLPEESAQKTLQKVDEAVGVRPQSVQQVHRVLYAPKKPWQRNILVVFLCAIALFGMSFIGYWVWKQTSEQPLSSQPTASTKALYETMLQNSMRVKSYQQTMTIGNRDAKTGAEARTIIAMERDVSDLAYPKLRGTVEVRQRQQSTTLFRKGQFLALGDKGTYFRLDESLDTIEESTNQAVTTPTPIDNEKLRGYWIVADEVATPETLSLGLFLSSVPTDDLNTVRGELTVGDVPNARRDELLDFLKNGQVYSITSSKPDKIEGQDVIAYQIAYTTDRLRTYNNMLPAPPKIVASPSNVPTSYVNGATLYVDPMRKLPVRMQFTKGEVHVVIDYARFNQAFEPMTAPPSPRSVNDAFGLI